MSFKDQVELAKAENDKNAHIPWLKKGTHIMKTQADKLADALRRFIYKTTHLSPMEDDGSHWCKIDRETLEIARKTLAEYESPAPDDAALVEKVAKIISPAFFTDPDSFWDDGHAEEMRKHATDKATRIIALIRGEV